MTDNASWILAADIGGTHITTALVNPETGRIASPGLLRKPVNANASALHIIDAWTEAMLETMDAADSHISGLAVAMPGPFDYETGIAAFRGLDKFDSLFGLDVFSSLQSRLGLTKIHFVNDAVAFGLGESWKGAAAGFNSTLAITLGTGLGSAFVKNAKWQNTGEGIPEGGFLYNQTVDDLPADQVFSSRGLLNNYRDLCGTMPAGVKELAELAERDDQNAASVFQSFGSALGSFLAPWLNGAQCESLVIGGNIARSMPLWHDSLHNKLNEYGADVCINVSRLGEAAGLLGAVRHYMDRETSEVTRPLRKSTQPILPSRKPESGREGYDIYPAFTLRADCLNEGYASLAAELQRERRVVVDGFAGIDWTVVRRNLMRSLTALGKKVLIYDVSAAMKPAQAIETMISPWTGGDDPLFGKRCPLELMDFFESAALREIKPDDAADICVITGCGAALTNRPGRIIYIDLPKNELQYRIRAGFTGNLGGMRETSPKAMYKRAYFIDWPVLNRHRAAVLKNIDWMLDGQQNEHAVWVHGEIFRQSLSKMARQAFRVRPWFEPGVWGGQWMKNHIESLPQDVPNYAWSFELISPENGLLFTDGLYLLEASFDWLMIQESDAVLGEAARRFTHEFPIRFDFLDTFNGGNLSVQVHPRTDYIHREFGENFTQDECYYILDTQNEAVVYLGFQEGIDASEFKSALADSQKNTATVQIDRFVQCHRARKHDLFLIPAGTIHASGKDNLVLEISSTPYIFTFKLYDWLRPDLDGKPRPLNLERGFDNLDFSRSGQRVIREHCSLPRTIDAGKGWTVEHLPTHADQFYDVHRLVFDECIQVPGTEQCHVLMLVEGSRIEFQCEEGNNQTFSFGETFIVPAATGNYRLINCGASPVKVVKAFVREGEGGLCSKGI